MRESLRNTLSSEDFRSFHTGSIVREKFKELESQYSKEFLQDKIVFLEARIVYDRDDLRMTKEILIFKGAPIAAEYHFPAQHDRFGNLEGFPISSFYNASQNPH